MQRVSKGKTVTDFGKTNRWQGIRSWWWGGFVAVLFLAEHGWDPKES